MVPSAFGHLCKPRVSFSDACLSARFIFSCEWAGLQLGTTARALMRSYLFFVA